MLRNYSGQSAGTASYFNSVGALMYGLILDFFWNGGQEPVLVTMTGSLAELRGVTEVDPSNVAAAWPRRDIYPLEQHRVRNAETGMILDAHICGRMAP